jgi:predicted transcriptional regulator
MNATTKTAQIRLSRSSPASYSSVRVMLARLEKKGYLKHHQAGVRYLYSATVPPSVAKRSALRQFVRTFFGGSLKKLMTAMVTDASWTDQDLGELRDEIDRVRSGRKPS